MAMQRSDTLRFSRRALLGSAALLAAVPFQTQGAPRLGADGLYEEPWFPKPTFDLRKDFASAASANKRFVMIWELRGCSWCGLLHMANFAREDIAAFAKEHFSFIQLNLRGARPCVDFDGEELSEELLGLKYEVASTPSIQFFAPADGEAPKELGRISYREPDEFLRILHLISEGRHSQVHFDEWQRSRGGSP
jgi:thioredoxin-related protein